MAEIPKASGFILAHTPPATPDLLVARNELMRREQGALLYTLDLAGQTLEIFQGKQSLWLIIRTADAGWIVFRSFYSSDGFLTMHHDRRGERLAFQYTTAIGEYRILLEVLDAARGLFHFTTWLTPIADLDAPHWPRDVYVTDAKGDPMGTDGVVHATQLGPMAPLIYFGATDPPSGTVLYFQNGTSLNDLFDYTGSSPSDLMGEAWPELGYRPPKQEKPLLAGLEVMLSDAYVRYLPEHLQDPREAAANFLDSLAEIYLRLNRPAAEYRDWPSLAVDTVKALTESSLVALEVDGHRYIRAYVGDEGKPPESMVQLAVLNPLLEYADWSGEMPRPAEELLAGLEAFYDPELHTVVRYLPSMPPKEQEEQEQPNVMDSWYLYHTMYNLGRLALRGEETARRLFLDSIDFSVRVAQRFDYNWPVFYDLRTLEVIKAETAKGAGGETDVPGLYLALMLEAQEITGENKYLEEARRAAETLMEGGFEIAYQVNNVCFGAGGLIRLWERTGDKLYLDLAIVMISNVLRFSWLWESEFGYSRYYRTFFGIGPLRDAPYLAAYEEVEVFSAAHDILGVGGDRLPAPVRLLLAEFCKYVLDHAWFFFPSHLPAEAISEEVKDGQIERVLAIPLEDLYDGRGKAGQVGQEVYGAAIPLAFVTRSYHHVSGAPFLLYCDYPTAGMEANRGRSRVRRSGEVSFHIRGDGRERCRIRLIPLEDEELPEVSLEISGRIEGAREGVLTREGHLEFTLSGNQDVKLRWKAARAPRAKRTIGGLEVAIGESVKE